MRLIDADALIEEFKARCICNCDRCKYQKGTYCGLIDNAPTVEKGCSYASKQRAYKEGKYDGFMESPYGDD